MVHLINWLWTKIIIIYVQVIEIIKEPIKINDKHLM